MKMSSCSVWASCALLIGHEFVPSEVVVCYLLIAQRALILEWDPRSVDLLIIGYMLEKLTASRLLRLTMLILRASLFESHQGLTQKIE
jgi:hypothetical protein